MTRAEIITLARQLSQEALTDTGFFSDSKLKDYLCLLEQEIATEAPELFSTTRTFTTVATQAEYDIDTYLGTDVDGIFFATYNGYRMDNDDEEDYIDKTVPSGQSYAWFIRGRTMILYPTPSAAVTVKCWLFRLPPSAVISVVHSGLGGATSATAAVASNTLTLIIGDGTYAGTHTFDLTAAALDTLTELIAAINALAVGFTAALTGETIGTTASASLEDFTTITCLTTALNMYYDPLIHRRWKNGMLNGLLYFMFREDGHQETLIKFYSGLWETCKMRARMYSMRAKRGFGYRSIARSSRRYVAYRSVGGDFITQ